MSAGTLIQWCYATINFWWGCTKVSRGCRKCYAALMAARLGRHRVTWGPTGLRWLRVGEACLALLKVEARALKRGERLRVFVNSMSDTFEDRRDLDSARGIIFAISRCVPHVDLMLLTKRIERVRTMVPADWLQGKWPANVWLGTSVEDQLSAAARVPVLCGLPAPVRFLSCEPLLAKVDLSGIDDDGTGHFDALRGAVFCEGRNEPAETGRIHWVIAGGESGAGATPCDLDWLRALRDQCAEAGTPFFLKQLGRCPVDFRPTGDSDGTREIVLLKLKDGHGGDMAEWPADLRVRQLPQPSYIL